MSQVFRQVMKFLTVGGGATAMHVATALALNGLANVPPLWANVLAFLAASGVTYFGNWRWTFDAASPHGLAVPRFMALSLSCFAVNQAIVYAFVEWAGRPLWVAMIPVVLVIPALSFWLSRTWIFQPSHANDQYKA